MSDRPGHDLDSGAGEDADALRRNPYLICALRAMQMALFPMAILSLFLHRQIGFGVTQIMLLQAVFGCAMVLLEFPSGYFADRFGYRRCLIFAFALWTIAWPIYGYSTTWLGVASAEFMLGVGMAMLSGCDTAMLYESLRVRGLEPSYARWAGRMTSCGQLAEAGAALCAGLLFMRAIELPFLAQAGASAVGMLCAIMLVEPARERPSWHDSFAQIHGMLRHVAHENPQLRAMFVASIVLGLASFVPVWTVQLYAVESELPEAWLGPMWAIANLSVALAALLSDRLFGSRSMTSLVIVSTVLIIAGFLGLGLSHSMWGVGAYYLLTIMRGLQGPALNHREQRLVPSSDRAGFLSMRSMVFRLGFLIIGPAVGWAVDARGQRPVMLVLALGFGAAGLLVVEVVRRAEAVERS